MKQYDWVKIKSVSGHNDISEAVGRIGQVKYVWENSKYCIRVRYVLPITCTCQKGCGETFWGDSFEESELEIIDVN